MFSPHGGDSFSYTYRDLLGSEMASGSSAMSDVNMISPTSSHPSKKAKLQPGGFQATLDSCGWIRRALDDDRLLKKRISEETSQQVSRHLEHILSEARQLDEPNPLAVNETVSILVKQFASELAANKQR